MSYHDDLLVALKTFLRAESSSDLPLENLESRLEQLQKRETLGLMAEGVAQGFTRLVTIILGYYELALQDMPAGHPVRGYLIEIGNAADQAARLSRQIASFADRGAREHTILDVAFIVEEVYRLVRYSLGEGIEFICIHAGALDRVQASPGQLEQVLVNLILNARDAMPEGGRITLVTENVILREELVHSHGVVPPGSYVRLAISDSGRGMDETALERIFQPFWDAKEPGGGSGLGLAIVQQIVHRNGGQIVVASQLGRGSTFAVYLPGVSGMDGEADRVESAAG